MASAANEAYMKTLQLTKYAPYLYEVHYSEWDYQIGADHFEKYMSSGGGCSAVRNGDYIGRNYDWYYDECASFVVHCYRDDSRHSSVGVAGGNPELTEEIADSGKYSPAYRYLPFMTVDGINDSGVSVEVNVVPSGDRGHTAGTNPDGEDISAFMITRYLLDYANNADHAVELLSKLNIFCPNTEDMSNEFHWMVSDSKKSLVVEFIDGELTVVDDFVGGKPVSTNFYLYGFDGNTSTAYYKSEEFDPETTTLTDHAMGLERYDIICDGYADADTKRGMIDLMKRIKYTNTYKASTNPFWYSEFSADLTSVGYGDLTIYSSVSDYAPLVENMIEAFDERVRDGATWQTVHLSVYNISEGMMWVLSQEGSDEYSFKLEMKRQDEPEAEGTSFDVFTSAFLEKIEEYKFIELPEEDRMNIVDGFMKRVCSQFNKVCKYDIVSADAEARVLTAVIPAKDLIEIVDVVSEGMVAQWMKPYVYHQELLQNVLNTRDYTTYSPAELLLRVGNAYAKVQKDYTQMVREYSYNHGDLTVLHI